MPKKKSKSNFAKFLIASASVVCLIALAKLIEKSKPSKKKKQITQEALQKELEEFIKDGNVEVNDPEKIQNDLKKYLKDKGYFFAEENMHLQVVAKSANQKIGSFNLPNEIDKISEDLNEHTKNLDIFADTTDMIPGLICYTIEEIAPTERIPFVRYKPVPRVITQIHDSGVNGGTIFFSYNYRFARTSDFGSQKSGKVIAESEVIYSPLTTQQAKYICKLLNVQSRLFYNKRILAEQRKAKLAELLSAQKQK